MNVIKRRIMLGIIGTSWIVSALLNAQLEWLNRSDLLIAGLFFATFALVWPWQP